MMFNFEPSVAENAEKREQDQIALDETTSRAHIGTLDEKIAHCEEIIRQSDAESAAMATEVRALKAQFKELRDGTMEIKSKQPKVERFVAKIGSKVNECTDELAKVNESIQAAHESIAEDADKLARKARCKQVQQAIEARKKLIEEVGYGNGDYKRLDEELNAARTRFAELKTKYARIEDLKRQLKEAQERNAEVKMKSWQKDSNEEPEVDPKAPNPEAKPLQSKRVPKRRTSRR